MVSGVRRMGGAKRNPSVPEWVMGFASLHPSYAGGVVVREVRRMGGAQRNPSTSQRTLSG